MPDAQTTAIRLSDYLAEFDFSENREGRTMIQAGGNSAPFINEQLLFLDVLLEQDREMTMQEIRDCNDIARFANPLISNKVMDRLAMLGLVIKESNRYSLNKTTYQSATAMPAASGMPVQVHYYSVSQD